MSFSKLFADIIHSTVWREAMHVKVVWITMLAMSDRHGQVMSSIPGLADSSKVTLEQCLDALKIFQSPDEYSRTKDYEGRRIMEIDGGWLILNYEKFRDRKDDEEQRIKTRERVRKFRAKAKGSSDDVTQDVTVTRGNDIQSQISDSESNSESDLKRLIHEACEQKSNFDPIGAEIGIIQTRMSKPNDGTPIRSVKYFFPEIEQVCAGLVALKPAAINDVLRRRREQYQKWLKRGDNDQNGTS